MCRYLTDKLEVQKAVSKLRRPRHFCFRQIAFYGLFMDAFYTAFSCPNIEPSLCLEVAVRLPFSPFPPPATFSYAAKGCWESTKSAGFWEKAPLGSFSRRSLRVLTDEWP